jgi:hypothetical protein
VLLQVLQALLQAMVQVSQVLLQALLQAMLHSRRGEDAREKKKPRHLHLLQHLHPLQTLLHLRQGARARIANDCAPARPAAAPFVF